MGYVEERYNAWTKGEDSLIRKSFETASNTVNAILRDPLPVVAQVVGASFGVPPYVTAAVITGARGGNIGDIAKSAAMSYASSELMTGTQIGADIKNYAVNMPSGDITDWAMENFNLSPDQAVMVAKASSAALNSSVVGGISAALTGKSVAEGVGSGFTSGLIYSSTDSYFNSVNKDPNWGFSPTALNVMKGATSTALNSLVSGKGDPAQVVGNYIAYAGVNMAGSEVSRMAKDAYVNLTTDTEAAQKAQDKFTTAKAELDSKAVEAENLRLSIINDDAERQKLYTEQYLPYKTKRDQLVAQSDAELNTYNQQKAIADATNEEQTYNNAVAAMEASANRLQSINTEAKNLDNQNKDIVQRIESSDSAIQKKLSDLQVMRADIEAPNADGNNLAAKAMAAAKEYETKYAAWSKTKSAADAANENYTKALAEVATRNATIDAMNSGAIKATGKDEAGNWLLNNGMTLTKDGRFMQDGKQAFTNAAGIDQNKIDFKDAEGRQVSFDINSTFNTAYANSQDARSSLMNELDRSNLTPEERTALNAAMQDVFAQSSTAQALPATTTDISTGTSRLGSAFASNDPVFKTALAKNPTLTKAFNEYTNTYGFAGGYDYEQLLNESLAQNPNDSNLQAEYKKVTGKDYQAPVSEAERIRQENAAKGLTPLTPTELPERGAVVNVEAGTSTPTPEQDAALLDKDVMQNSGLTEKTPELTLDQQLAQLFKENQKNTVDRSQDVKVADIGRAGDPGSGVYYDPSRGAWVVSDTVPPKEPLITEPSITQDNKPKESIPSQTSPVIEQPLPENQLPKENSGPATTTGPIEGVKLDLPQQNTTTVLPIEQENAGFNVGTNQVTGSAPESQPAGATNTAGSAQGTGASGATTGTTGTTGTGTQTNLADVQTQFNARVDQLIKQGQDYQTATNTAIKEIGAGVAGLQTNLTQLQTQQAAEKEKAEAAAKVARATKAQQGISQNLANAAVMATPALAAGAMDESIPGTKDIGLKTSGEAKFEGPLDQYLKMVKENTYVPKPQQPQQQNQQGAPMQDALTPSQQGSDYFAYGQQPEMNDLLGGSSGGDLLYSKEGGLAVPMMAGGGSTRYGKYAGGGLNVINHSGKARLDFRKGDAVTGPGDGQSDDIPAMLADGEFVFPADVVAALGNGSTKAGSDKLYEMMHSIRAYHRSAKPKDLPPPAKKSPLDYLKKSKARR
jgi:hypothetical protein